MQKKNEVWTESLIIPDDDEIIKTEIFLDKFIVFCKHSVWELEIKPEKQPVLVRIKWNYILEYKDNSETI